MKRIKLGIMTLLFGCIVIGSTGCDLQGVVVDSARGAVQQALDDAVGGVVGGTISSLLGQLPIPLG